MNLSVNQTQRPTAPPTVDQGAKAQFATTVSGWGDERFRQRSRPIHFPRVLDQIPRTRFRPLAELTLFVAVLVAALHEDVLLLFSSRGYLKPELLATAFIGLWPRGWRPQIIFYGEMFEPDRDWRYRLERVLMRLVDRAVFRFALHSAAELPLFARLWSINPEKLRVTGFFSKQTVTPRPVVRRARGSHIFAGGTSFRNYEPLLQAARLMPEQRFVICTNRIADTAALPPNVTVGLVPPAEYDELLGTAAAVVVPLRQDVHRSTGMLTYLQAMWAKQPVIVTDTLGVREYVTDGETGIIVDGSPEGYVAAIRRVLDPAERAWVDALCERAHQAVCEEFTVARHVDRLLALVDEAVAAAEHKRKRSRDRTDGEQ
jgi:glycosyltransferase involved in cell wall biosynthesis